MRHGTTLAFSLIFIGCGHAAPDSVVVARIHASDPALQDCVWLNVTDPEKGRIEEAAVAATGLALYQVGVYRSDLSGTVQLKAFGTRGAPCSGNLDPSAVTAASLPVPATFLRGRIVTVDLDLLATGAPSPSSDGGVVDGGGVTDAGVSGEDGGDTSVPDSDDADGGVEEPPEGH